MAMHWLDAFEAQCGVFSDFSDDDDEEELGINSESSVWVFEPAMGDFDLQWHMSLLGHRLTMVRPGKQWPIRKCNGECEIAIIDFGAPRACEFAQHVYRQYPCNQVVLIANDTVTKGRYLGKGVWVLGNAERDPGNLRDLVDEALHCRPL